MSGSKDGRPLPQGRRRDSRSSRGGGQQTATTAPPVFSPDKPLAELVDKLAEQQARMMPSGREELKSSQLRRFFGEVKDLYRRLENNADYKTEIEPMFKMLRSKASYACRKGQPGQQKIPTPFFDLIDNGVSKVTNEGQFRAFVQHFEAVVGFLYGLGKVGK